MTTTDLIVIDENKVALIKRTVAKDATDDELELFLHQARRMGLDPLARQIHFQKFRSKDGKSNVSFITTIDGYRLIADRTGVYAGSDEPVFEGKIKDSFYGAGQGPNIPAKATITVHKIVAGALRAFTNSAYWQEYYPGNQRGHMWRKMPHVMLAKVAEAGALRKAFPADLSGVYTADEMEQSVTIITPSVDAKRERQRLAEVVDIEVERDAARTPDDDEPPDTGPLPDDEVVIYEGEAIDFWTDTLALIDRYTVAQHAQAAAKKLGFKAVPKSAAKRLEMYRALRDYAATRDAEEVEARDSKLAEQAELFEDELTGGAFAE